ncbi:chromosome segregation protein Csm1/Pcs1-domain-containing protein [Tricladium varicosporioides]|nr:chromosome segregation protein Csm1/Pcs1-domain-containing protein [Hymenoscyphus varicosporioides]
MSKLKQRKGTLSGLIDSESEDEQFIEQSTLPIPNSEAENMAPEKKARGRPKAALSKVVKSKAPTKAKAPARRTSGRLNKEVMSTPTQKEGKRKVLADKTNQQHANDTEEVDEFAQDDDMVTEDIEVDYTVNAIKQTKSKATKKRDPIGRGRTTKDVIKTAEDTEVSVAAEFEPKPPPARRGKPAKKEIPEEVLPEKVIMESQVPTIEMNVDADDGVDAEQTVTRTSHNLARARGDSRAPQPSLKRRRAGSASDTERSDPALRRKLGEMTKKYETLHIKYQDLKEIGIKESDKNFDRLKKQSEENAKTAKDEIATLKADVAAQTALAKESRTLKKKLQVHTADLAALHLQISQLQASLTEAKSEIKTKTDENKTILAEKRAVAAENKTLSAKLAANRSAASSVESANAKIPGSAMKANGGIRLMGTAEAAQAAQAAQLKEDLYSDLTGLIIRGVKRESEEDLFDCIQTGRNGTLHFKLSAANDKSADSYDDSQCSYVPQLDPSRDRALMELLPDYLVDEITFPRPQAAKFYARVVKALTEKAP